MANTFAITTAITKLVAESGRATSVWTVTNTSLGPERAIIKIRALGATQASWISIDGESDLDFSAGGTHQFTVIFSKPEDPVLPTGQQEQQSFPFRLDVVSANDPDEDFTEGPVVTVDVPILHEKEKRHFPWWIAAVAALILITGGVCLYLLWPRPAVTTVIMLGHEGHGKSTLTAAIVKVLAESGRTTPISYNEIANPSVINVRGARIAATRIEYETEKARYVHFDCQNPSDCVVALSSEREKPVGAILVVSAADGPMPQTRDQLRLAQAHGIKSLAVYLNKTDLVNDPELIQLVEIEIRELLTQYGFEGNSVPMVRGSALSVLNNNEAGKETIRKLLNAMDSSFPK